MLKNMLGFAQFYTLPSNIRISSVTIIKNYTVEIFYSILTSFYVQSNLRISHIPQCEVMFVNTYY